MMERIFRISSDGVRYQVEVFDKPWWRPFGGAGWRRVLLPRYQHQWQAEFVLNELRMEERAKQVGYMPMDEQQPGRAEK